MSQGFRARSIPHERRLLEASVLLPTASRLHPHPRTSVFAHISLIYGRFRELTRGISLIYIYIYMALVLVGKAISGVNIPSKSPCYQGHLPYIRQIVLSRPSIDHQIVGNRDQLNPTTCSATKYPLRITKRPIDPRKFNARDMAFLRTSL